MHIDELDDILYADDKDKGNGEEYQLIGINAWCNRFTWITCDSYDLTINRKDKCCAPVGTGKLYSNPRITTNGEYFFNSVLRPFQDYVSSYETGQSVGGRKREIPEKKHLTHPQAEVGLSHMLPAQGSNPHQAQICSIHSSTREAVSPEQCVLMTRTAKASMAFGRICANVISEMKQRSIPS